MHTRSQNQLHLRSREGEHLTLILAVSRTAVAVTVAILASRRWWCGVSVSNFRSKLGNRRGFVPAKEKSLKVSTLRERRDL